MQFVIGPEVVLAARCCPKAKSTSTFDSPTPILYIYRLSVEILSLSLTVEKLFVCIYFGWKFGIIWFQNLGSSGGFDPKM
jgi:hypothetical protein